MTSGGENPVGLFDSGVGGLSVLRQIIQRMPGTDAVYLGDSGRAPYGSRDPATLLDFAEDCVEALFRRGCRVVIAACHTISCTALRHLQRKYSGPRRRVLGVTIPAAEAAVAQSRGGVGFIGTARTVASGTFTAEVRKLGKKIRVTEVAAPLLMPIVEEGLEATEIARHAVRHYLRGFGKMDTLVLGCTHYPLLAKMFAAEVGPDVRIVDPAVAVAEKFEDWLARHPGFTTPRRGKLHVLLSGDHARFERWSARLLPGVKYSIESITERRGRLVSVEKPVRPAKGQVLRGKGAQR